MVKRLAFISGGWGLCMLGAVGLFLPILPGVLLLIFGLSILSLEYEWARRWMSTLRRRFPATDKKLQGFLARKIKPAVAPGFDQRPRRGSAIPPNLPPVESCCTSGSQRKTF
ncbi:MAG: PGPGW domain-containing protein [Candidatus Angelobacter sp.]